MYSIHRQVSQSDMDSAGNLSLLSAINYMQDCSFFHITTQDALTSEFKKRNMGMFLISRQFKRLRNIKFGEKLKIVTWVYDINAFFGFRNTLIYDESGKVCAVSCAGGSFVDLETGLPKRVGQEVSNIFCIKERYAMQYLPRKICLPKGSPVRLEPFKVLRSHLDHYKHVNNARYISMAIDLLPSEFQANNFRVEYRKPAKLGDIIYPIYYAFEETYIVVLENEHQKIFALIELKS